MSDIGPDFAFKTFFGVGSLDIQGSNPEESLDTTYLPFESGPLGFEAFENCLKKKKKKNNNNNNNNSTHYLTCG